MAGSVNKVILIGNLGRDPEIRSLNNGDRVANLRLATSENWRDKATGERRERTEWHSIVIFNENLVRVVEQYTRKGSKLYVEGELQTRKWQDQSGQDRYTTEIVLQRFRGNLTLLDGRNDGGSHGGGHDGHMSQSGMNQSAPQSAPPQSSRMGGTDRQGAAQTAPFADDLDDDVPF